MSKEEIREKILNILHCLLPSMNNRQASDKEILSAILSESKMAITFVSLIEDEFEIEFDDDEIDTDFFYSIDNIINCIEAHHI
jgi:acyl carrier protein